VNLALSKTDKLTAAELALTITLAITIVQVSFALDWSLDTRLTADIGWDNAPSIIQTEDGKVWVAWHSDRNGNEDIFYKFFDGSSWSGETQLTTDAQNDMNPSIMQAQDGRIWVVWDTDRKLLDEDIYYRVFDGLSWSGDTPLCTELYPDKNPSITQTSDGLIWVVWSSISPAGDPELFYKTFNGSGWSTEFQLTNDQNMDDEDPAIMQAMDGKVWVAWSKKNKAKNEDVYYKTFDGGTWSANIQLTTDSYIDSSPTITQSMNGRIWVTWSSSRKANNLNVYYKIFDGVYWTSDLQLTSAMEDDKTPSIMQATNGSIWTVWASKRVLAQYDIYYKLGLELHDIAVLGITPYAPHNSTIAFRNEVVNIYVGIQNDGEAVENVEVQCYVNSSLIESKVVSLISGQYLAKVFKWNTTGVRPGSYAISAYAVPVVGELDLTDNSLTDGSVEVRIGDIAGVYNGVVQPIPDRRVDAADFGITIGHFGHNGPSWPHPAWDPVCDVNEDWKVNIDDIMLVGVHYGETY
jgi:hypothetical protein